MSGGLGTRMKSSIPKVLHHVGGEPMLIRIIKQAQKLNPEKILVVAGKYKDLIESEINKHNLDVEYINQEPALGTGHAIMCCRKYLLTKNENSKVLILSGDAPLITYNTISNMLDTGDCKILTTVRENPFGYGRIIEKDGIFLKIVEEKDGADDERQVKKVNCGVYAIKNELLCKYLPYIKNNNVQGEYYLTDIIEIIKNNGHIVSSYNLDKEKQYELTNVNDKEQLKYVNKLLDEKTFSTSPIPT